MVRRTGILALVFLPLLCHAGPAYGANASSPSDPSAGSPAGAVYQLPFEEGRSDGAPKGTGGTGAPGGGPGGGSGGGSGTGAAGGGEGGEPSTYRSENNFGSSSQVPGVGSGGSGGGGENGGSGSGQGGSGAGGSTDGGSSDPNSTLGVAELTDSGNTSPAANIGLLLLIVLVAGGVGYVTMRSRRLKEQR
jgi:hypothetical protein